MTTEQLQRQLVYIREKIQQALEQAGRKGENRSVMCSQQNPNCPNSRNRQPSWILTCSEKPGCKSWWKKYAVGAYGSHPGPYDWAPANQQGTSGGGAKRILFNRWTPHGCWKPLHKRHLNKIWCKKSYWKSTLEESKAKVALLQNNCPFLLEQAENCNHVQVLGLMAIPQSVKKKNKQGNTFPRCTSCFVKPKTTIAPKVKWRFFPWA